MVICLQRGADLHMSQLMPFHSRSLPSVKSRLVLPYWYRHTWVDPEKGPLNGCVCVFLPVWPPVVDVIDMSWLSRHQSVNNLTKFCEIKLDMQLRTLLEFSEQKLQVCHLWNYLFEEG